jgi:hypothetical protein
MDSYAQASRAVTFPRYEAAIFEREEDLTQARHIPNGSRNHRQYDVQSQRPRLGTMGSDVCLGTMVD